MSDVVWSVDQEDFKFDSLDEALEYLYEDDDLYAGRVVYFGTPEKPRKDGFIKASQVLDMIGDAAYDFAGEHADGFPDVSEDATRELAEFLSQWCNKHLDVTFYQIVNVQQYAVKEKDLADYPELIAKAQGHAHE